MGQLRAESAIEPLVNLLNRIDLKVDDWVQVELPDVLAMIGPAAIPALDRFLADPDNGLWARGAAAGALSKIGVQYAEARDRCVELVTSQLQRFREQDLDLNALLIDALVELHAVESAPVIAEAFAADKVELSLRGDWEEIQIALGLLDERITPPPPGGWVLPFLNREIGLPDTEYVDPLEAQRRQEQQRESERAKKRRRRKLAKQTKQKQRRKKKKR